MALMIAIMGSGATAWGQKITSVSNIVSGKTYYIGATNGSGTDYYFKTTYDQTGESVAGTAVTDKADAVAITFTNTAGNWILQFDNGYYLGLKSSKDNGKVQILENSANWTITDQTNKIRLTMGSYSLQKNNSGTQFGSYANTQTDVWLEEAGPSQLTTPTNFTATPGNTQATFNWTAVQNASSYKIAYKASSDEDFTEQAVSGGSTTSYPLTGLTNDTEYTCKIKAVGDGTNYTDSDYSNTLTVTPIGATFYTVTISDQIQNGSVTANPLSATEGTEITLSATPASGYEFGAWDVKDAGNNPITVSNNKFNMPASNVTVNATFTLIPTSTYTLVTSASDLVSGAKYLIVGTALSNENNVALGWQDENNRKSAVVTISNNSISTIPATSNSETNKAFEVTLGGTTGAWTLFDAVNNGYLYAGSSSKNWLMVQETNDANGVWTITISDNIASITAQGSNTRNKLKQNGNIFSCYASGQTAVALYKRDEVKAATPTLPASCVFDTKPFEVTITNNEDGATVYYTTDGNDPTTSSSSFTGASTTIQINQTTTVKAMAVIDGKANSTIASATYTEQKADPNNHWSVEAYTATIGGSNSFPTFTTSSDGDITYTSSNTNAAIIASNGDITLVNPGVTTITASTPETATYMAGEASYILTVKNAPLSTMDAIFAKATGVGSTATDVEVAFNNWVISGASGSNAYLTDGTKGLIIYGSSHGFEVGDILSGTANCKVQLYNGASELTNLTSSSEGLTVTKNGEITPVTMTIDQITSGVYTGAVIKIENVLYNGTNLSDGTNTIKPYNKLYNGMSFTNDKYYNVTGVYLQYNSTKEIMPRDAADIEELAATEYDIELLQNEGGTISADKATAAAGVEVTLSYVLSDGYVFDGWTVLDDELEEVTVEDNVFTMPESNVVVEATFISVPTYTINYTTNGIAESATTVVNQGDAIGTLAEPTAANIPNGYVFRGWSANDVTLTDDEPTYVLATDVPTGNMNLKAVFAIKEADAEPDTWTKISLSEVTVTEGTYALLTTDGHAFNGSISSGHGQVTSSAFTFTNGVATAAPEGVCELTFTTSGDGFTMYKDGKGYLYASAASSGKLAWHDTESSYWSYASSNWKYASNSAYLRSYNNSSIRTYSTNNGDVLVLAKKVLGTPAIYSNFCTSVNALSGNLAEAETSANTAYYISDEAYVPANETVTINGVLGNANASLLIVNDGAQLIHSNAGVAATVKKSITGYNGGSGNYYLIAAPMVSAVSTSGIAIGTYDLYAYDEVQALWLNAKQEGSTFNTLNPQQGYLYANYANQEVSMAGTLNPSNEAMSYNLSFARATDDFKGFNLVGNPFACNASVNGSNSNAFYKMNEDGTEVEAVINPVVAPCTGIFALATDESQTVTFTKNTTGEPNVTRGLLTIAISKAEGRANKQVDRAIVSFDEISALPKFNINAGNSKLYIPQGNKNYAVVNAEAEGSLPLCFEANQRGNYTISVNTENLNVEYLHLIDNMTGADTDLLVEESYSFKSNRNDYASRFKLVFKANAQNDEMNEVESSFAYISNGEIVISNEGRATLQVIDMMGRVLNSQSINGDCRISVNGMTAGVYVLNLNGKTQKIVVR